MSCWSQWFRFCGVPFSSGLILGVSRSHHVSLFLSFLFAVFQLYFLFTFLILLSFIHGSLPLPYPDLISLFNSPTTAFCPTYVFCPSAGAYSLFPYNQDASITACIGVQWNAIKWKQRERDWGRKNTEPGLSPLKLERRVGLPFRGVCCLFCRNFNTATPSLI